MSHFSVVACIDGSDDLIKHARYAEENQGFTGLVRSAVEECVKRAMAPWDENLEAEPYRSYEEGSPDGFWMYSYLRRAAEDFAAGTGIKPYDPDGPSYSSESSRETPEEQRRKQQADAEQFRALPDPITWADIAKLHNERYSDDDPLLVDESGRAYQMSTANKDAKWDYWRVGGRWGGYFPFRSEHSGQVLKPSRGWDSPEVIMPDTCDGGPKLALDLAALREKKAAEARKRFGEWQELTAGTPDALPWSSFTENISDGNGYTIGQARDEYHSQPRVERIKGSDFQWMDDPIATFGVGLKRYVATETARAVPGYATVTTDGRWMAPGRMGWFGISDHDEGSQIGYWEAANAYIEALPDDTFLVALDCHI